MKLYIAGPMRGLPEHNYPAFRAAAKRFRALGFDVTSPVELSDTWFGPNHADEPRAPEAYMRVDLAAIADECDAIALLPGWERSVGARCAVVVAVTLGFSFYDALTAQPIPAPTRVVCAGGYELAPGAVDTLDALADEIRAWQAVTFPKATPSSVAEHLRREAGELVDHPEDEEEMADIFLLLCGASRGRDLVGAVRRKLEKNKRRVWGVPDEHGVVEHVSEGAPAAVGGAT